ncbi:MAG: bifunctional hydroxymethylpyrimidine kinase/phosphomethylpyrimidine kinase [Akkermansiaceae bacterium]|nr:bifunctional hydroxymethylpyrimidine kinase/phosphomethylpyrimidine kinase [Verrucomicrobiales bacterium]
MRAARSGIRPRIQSLPVALTIAGSDSGGGAGIQADLKTFATLNVHGTSAITCITAQNPKGVLGIQACKPEIVRQQIEAVFGELRPAAVKTGMLFSTEIIRVVVEYFQTGNRPPLIVDPVMIATSGSRLLKPSAIRLLTTRLLPFAALVTPNLDEAKVLIGRDLTSVEDLRSAAREIHERFGCAALLKGGHLRTSREAADIFFDGKTELLLTAPFVKSVSTHGTGCTYSAAITAYLALGKPLSEAVALAKDYITQAIAQSLRARSHWVLNHRSAGLGPRKT